MRRLSTTPPYPKSPRPIVLIGAGGIVRDAHLPAYRKAGFPVAGVYDLDHAKAARLAESFGIRTVYSTLAEAATGASPGAVFDLAVPASAIRQVLPHVPDGAGVLIQKPMGESLAEARAIRDLCHVKRLEAGLNFQLRYAPFVIAARDLIEQGAIGDVHGMEVRVAVVTPWHLWTFLEQVACAEIYYHSIHYFDLCRSFLGNPRGVYAKSVRHPSAATLDGTRGTYILDYGDRTRVTITADHHGNYGLAHQESYIQWSGTRGAIRAKMGLLMKYPDGVPDVFEYCMLQDGAEPTWQQMSIPGSWFPDAFIGTMASVMRRLDGSAAEIPTSVDDAFHTMALADAACRSSHSGATSIAAG